MAAKTPTVDVFLATWPATVAETCQTLRSLILKAIPAVEEKVMIGWKLIGYRVPSPLGSHYLGFVAPWPDRAVLGFEYGVNMTDPHNLLTGKGTQVRQIEIVPGSDWSPEIVTEYILAGAKVAIDMAGGRKVR